MALLWRVMISLLAISIRHQVCVENPLLGLVIDVVIWNLLILNLIYHWWSLISISRLKDILIRNLGLLLLSLNRIHAMDSRRLNGFAHILESKDWLCLVVVMATHWVAH